MRPGRALFSVLTSAYSEPTRAKVSHSDQTSPELFFTLASTRTAEPAVRSEHQQSRRSPCVRLVLGALR